MRIAVIGCGSLGLLWGCRVAQMPYESILFTRTIDQRNSLNKNGIIMINGEERRKFSVLAEVVSLSYPTSFDVVFVMVKQRQLIDLVPFIQSITHPNSQILFFQNGVGHEKIIKCLYHRPWTYAAVTTEGALRVKRNEVHYTGRGTTRMGYYPDKKELVHPILKQVVAYLSSNNVELREEFSISIRIWEKLIINCVINALTAVYGIRNGELLSPCFKKKMNYIIQEAVLVAEKCGFFFNQHKTIETICDVCKKTEKNYSSTVQDLRRSTLTEIRYINGAIVYYGAKFNVPTPYNSELLHQIRRMEKKTAFTEKCD